jgi:hypothetical protein
MKEAAAERVYLRMLEAVGARANDIGPGIIAAHWPFVGSYDQGLGRCRQPGGGHAVSGPLTRHRHWYAP